MSFRASLLHWVEYLLLSWFLPRFSVWRISAGASRIGKHRREEKCPVRAKYPSEILREKSRMHFQIFPSSKNRNVKGRKKMFSKKIHRRLETITLRWKHECKYVGVCFFAKGKIWNSVLISGAVSLQKKGTLLSTSIYEFFFLPVYKALLCSLT